VFILSVVLRKCRICNKEAITVEDLEGFTKNNKSPYGRTTLCKPCGSTDSLCYDHDHNKKGIVAFRGVLCRQCNQAIGQLGDTEEGILQALQYLRRYNEQFN